MQAVALLGGPSEQWPENIEQIFRDAKIAGHLILASDRGTLFLKRWDILPDVAVGDFDSLKKDEKLILNDIPDVRYSQPIKNYTDSEQLFLTALADYHVDNLFIYGATGGRLDHFFVNIFTFLRPELCRFVNQVELVDKQNVFKFYSPGKYLIKYRSGYKYIGFGNLEKTIDFSILDARYELNNFSSEYPNFFSSNEFINHKDFEIKFKAGIILAIYSKDINRYR
ncbi:thiamine pyrophosphokinase [Lactobacillus colini]|uniref:Thiamine diphosphokinase n=1 Tax=Lactobacillus colini TaxID=1819254 RepID=A0ABS4MBA5_9LACO|nr:thiamine diphosphokinase [Lactobacillus colini]MBP2056936.1 thiamine pyrophosphokinase [Lactobacillus colini]